MRVFIFGDSFAMNLFQEHYESLERFNKHPHAIKEYLLDLKQEGIDDALWFSDWLQKWGYEVYNYGIGGSDNQTILEQFSILENNYQEGDRIILWLSTFLRFQWFNESGNRYSVVPGGSPYGNVGDDLIKTELLWRQCVNREISLKKNYIKKTTVPYLEYFFNLHQKYNPIVVSFCNDSVKALENCKWLFTFNNIGLDLFKKFSIKIHTSINKESNDLISDGHYGRQTNYYYAIIFDEIIKSGLNGNYSLNLELLNKIKDRIENDKTEFTIPEKWKKNGTKKILTNLI